MSGSDAIALTRSLLQFDTVNPPGRERDCARYAGSLLEEWGYRVDYHEYQDSRTSLIARGGGSDAKAPLCLTGHLDVVPIGSRPWTRDPFLWGGTAPMHLDRSPVRETYFHFAACRERNRSS